MAGAFKVNGNRKGAPNRRTLDTDAVFHRIIEKHGDPLEALAEMAFDLNNDIQIRQASLKELVQYGYCKKRSVEVTGKDGGAIEVDVRLDLVSQISKALDLLAKK